VRLVQLQLLTVRAGFTITAVLAHLKQVLLFQIRSVAAVFFGLRWSKNIATLRHLLTPHVEILQLF